MEEQKDSNQGNYEGSLYISYEFKQEELEIKTLTPLSTCQDLLKEIAEQIHGVNTRGDTNKKFTYHVEFDEKVVPDSTDTLQSIGMHGGNDVDIYIYVNCQAGSKSNEKIEIDTNSRDLVFKDHKEIPKVKGKCIMFGDKDEICAKITECGCLISVAGMRGLIQYILNKDGFSRIYCQTCYYKKKKYIFWNYQRCLHIANLETDVRRKIARVFSRRYREQGGHFKKCPNCLVLNKKAPGVTKYRVNCSSCYKDFCFRCSKSWIGTGMIVCGNKTCPTHRKKQRLLNCDVLKDELVKNKQEELEWKNDRGWWIKRFPNQVPCLRACPGCLSIMKHARECPHMKCTSCGVDFCWICLNPKYYSHDSGSCKLADRQDLSSL